MFRYSVWLHSEFYHAKAGSGKQLSSYQIDISLLSTSQMAIKFHLFFVEFGFQYSTHTHTACVCIWSTFQSVEFVHSFHWAIAWCLVCLIRQNKWLGWVFELHYNQTERDICLYPFIYGGSYKLQHIQLKTQADHLISHFMYTNGAVLWSTEIGYIALKTARTHTHILWAYKIDIRMRYAGLYHFTPSLNLMVTILHCFRYHMSTQYSH